MANNKSTRRTALATLLVILSSSSLVVVEGGKLLGGRFFDRNKNKNKKNSNTNTNTNQNTHTNKDEDLFVPPVTLSEGTRAIPNFAMAEMTPQEIADGISSRTWAAQCLNSGDYGRPDVGCDAGSKICVLDNQYIAADTIGNSCARCINSYDTIQQVDFGCDEIYRRCLDGNNQDPNLWEGGTKCGLPCNIYSTIEGDVQDKITWFHGGNELPAGMYEIKYVGGCHKVTYDPGFSWCVHSNFESYRNWYVVDETYDKAYPGNVLAPGIVGHTWNEGDPEDYDVCVERNLNASKPLLYQHKGGKLGIYNFDKDPYSQPVIMLYYDNVEGLVSNPTWSLKVVQCPDADSNTPVDDSGSNAPEDGSKAPCCAAGESGWRPYKGCKQFYYCMNGKPLATQKCGAGTLFNGVGCDWAYNVQCGKIKTKAC